MPSILAVSERVPWPTSSGGAIRTFHLLQQLSEEFDVGFVGGANTASQAAEGTAALREFCHHVEVVPDKRTSSRAASILNLSRTLLRNEPAFVAYHWNSGVDRAVQRALATSKYELLHLDHLDTVPYSRNWPADRFVIDTHNLLHQYFQRRSELEKNPLLRPLMRAEARRLFAYELDTFRRAGSVITCSEAERQTLLQKEPDLAVFQVPNGVDCDHFKPVQGQPRSGKSQLVFVGNMAYEPNHDAALYFGREVLPRIVERQPEVSFLVVGSDPKPELLRLAADRAEIEVTGFVEDVRPYFRKATIFVVPIRFGSGTRLKVLEAFAMALPVVSTSLGAEGIAYSDGRDIAIADEPARMADIVCRLVQDPEELARMGGEARETAVQNYDWGVIGRQIREVYRNLGKASPA
jgi:sugar transferase (PEP-CTERM/EpsH1 system associated)